MDDIKNIVNEIDSILENKELNTTIKNITNNYLNKIYFDLEELKDVLLNKANLPLSFEEQENAYRLNAEIEKREKIVQAFMPLLINAHFCQK